MMEKTLILKHISRMLCLLISYSKFTRTDFAEAIENRIAMYYNKGVKFSLASVRLSARSIVHR